MSGRFFVDLPLATAQALALPADVARHVQVLRLQPGDTTTLFNGLGGEWQATVLTMGRRDVAVRIDTFEPADRELSTPVLLAVGMPANDRFDWLIEKATELGAHAVQPLQCERSVLRLDGERAERKRAHWQGIARAAAEQCGRTRVPTIAAPCKLSEFLRDQAAWPVLAALGPAPAIERWMLSLSENSQPLSDRLASARTTARTTVTSPADSMRVLLSGPEGGLSPAEEEQAQTAGFQAFSLGPRVLRSETAPLAALACLALLG